MTPALVDELARKLGQSPPHKPRRAVTVSGHRVRGIVPPYRFQRSMSWESDIELRLIYRLLTSWRTADAATQAIKLSIPPAIPGDLVFPYTPDAIVKAHDGTLICVECKPAAHLVLPELRAKHRAINLFLSHRGVRFVEVTEQTLAPSVPHENAKTLMRGLQGARRVSQAELRRRTAALLPCTFSALIEALGMADARATLFYGHAYFDMHRPLIGTTQLTNHLENHFDAANFLYA